MINVNVYHYAYFARIFLERLAKREQRSLIFTVSSIKGEMVPPGFQTYTGSKRFVYHLSKGMQYEQPKVDTVVLMANGFESKITAPALTMTIATTSSVCKDGIAMTRSYHKESRGCWWQELQNFFMKFMYQEGPVTNELFKMGMSCLGDNFDALLEFARSKGTKKTN